MSGTSADGVDVAIVEVEGRGLAMTARVLSHAYEPFTPELRRQILDVRQRGEVRLSDLAEIGRQVTLGHVRGFAAARLGARVDASQIAAIAAHGQTLFHSPPSTIQYFDPSLLAFETGCAVVSDFRRADLAAGGQGAPLVPFADWILFRHPIKNRVILNIGGIANLTYLRAGGAIEEVIAFDTGPGNCLSDWICQKSAETTLSFDEGGELALQGSSQRSRTTALFTRDLCLAFNRFATAPPPKSTDGPAMIALFEEQLARVDEPVALVDQLAVANEIVVNCILLNAIMLGILDNAHANTEWFVGGGGALNLDVMQKLRRYVSKSAEVVSSLSSLSLPSPPSAGVTDQTEEVGVDLAAAREAIAFALLGAATLDGEPSNVPSATGASRRVVLGSITPKPSLP